MLNAGNKIGIIKNVFSDVVKLRSGREKTAPLFILDTRIANRTNATLNEIKRGIIDNGAGLKILVK
jgi:hypothetical protein